MKPRASLTEFRSSFWGNTAISVTLIPGDWKEAVGQLTRGLTPPPTPPLRGEGSLAPPSVKKRLRPLPSPLVGENERGGKGAGGLGFPNSPTACWKSRL